ncbi:transposase [Lacticaseibacillus saniviri]
MTKYSSELKIKVVSEYFRGRISQKELCRKYGIVYSQSVRNWFITAKQNGLAALKVKREKTKYTQKFKIDVVSYVQTHQLSFSQAAAHFNISQSQVYSWTKIVREEGIGGLRSTPKGKPAMSKKRKPIKPIKRRELTQEEKYQKEIRELKQKLFEAELDRDILKTLAALTEEKKNKKP